MKLLIAGSLMFLMLVLPGAASGADDASPPGKRGPQAEEFYRRLAEMQACWPSCPTCRCEYATADEEKRAEI